MLSYEVKEKTLLVYLPEEVDDHNCRGLQKDTERWLRKYDLQRILFDFSRVSFMDSSGIGILLGRYKRMGELNGDVAVCGVSGRVKRLLHMSGVDRMVKIYEGSDDGIR